MKQYIQIAFVMLVMLACTPAKSIFDGQTCASGCVRRSVYWVDGEFSDAQRDEIDAAFASWTRASGGRECFDPWTGESSMDVTVWRVKLETLPLLGSGVHADGYSSPNGTLRIADTVTVAQTRSLLEHEIGHWMGLGHDADAKSIMHATVPESITAQDRINYCRARGCSCP